MTGMVATSSSASKLGAFDANGSVASCGARSSSAAIADRDVDAVGADLRLQLGRRAVRDGPAVVEHDDVVGELVGLLEVLRREDDRGAVAHEVAQHVPQVVAAARVEPGGRLVEEQHLGRGDEARGEVEPPAHAAGERLHQLRRRVGEVEPLEQLVGAPARASALDRWWSRPTITRFLRALISPSTVACCAATPMRPRTASGSATTSMPATVADPSVGCGERGEDADRRGLARAVVAEQTEDRARGDVEVEIPQRPEVAEALAQALGRDPAAVSSAVGGDDRMPYVCLRT